MTLTPRDAFTQWQQSILSGSAGTGGVPLADDVVVEWPFNPPERPRRIDGRAAFEAVARAGRAALPVRFEEFSDVVVHETSDPEVVVAEYRLGGTVLATGRRASAPFILVLRVRDGQIVHVREYQDVAAMERALGGPLPSGRA
ncbi:hypothetical protein Pth03_02830 [Planotetraspora thailandica]|uniref:SnoaL-like domain-containing protein n=1 Tax=Planotetraspora thailandica TaxID=487172 RepID=A0A8J3UTR8_9ACTN|nr:nuclear transport factor 2 family protein [Planotetraspora thailandica]GII51894.1 hypothetical protein Pth03_02830 [Planotetraspora thailandica]